MKFSARQGSLSGLMEQGGTWKQTNFERITMI